MVLDLGSVLYEVASRTAGTQGNGGRHIVLQNPPRMIR